MKQKKTENLECERKISVETLTTITAFCFNAKYDIFRLNLGVFEVAALVISALQAPRRTQEIYIVFTIFYQHLVAPPEKKKRAMFYANGSIKMREIKYIEKS